MEEYYAAADKLDAQRSRQTSAAQPTPPRALERPAPRKVKHADLQVRLARELDDIEYSASVVQIGDAVRNYARALLEEPGGLVDLGALLGGLEQFLGVDVREAPREQTSS